MYRIFVTPCHGFQWIEVMLALHSDSLNLVLAYHQQASVSVFLSLGQLLFFSSHRSRFEMSTSVIFVGCKCKPSMAYPQNLCSSRADTFTLFEIETWLSDFIRGNLTKIGNTHKQNCRSLGIRPQSTPLFHYSGGVFSRSSVCFAGGS